MHEVGAGRDNTSHFFAQTGEVGRQYAGSYAVVFRHERFSGR